LGTYVVNSLGGPTGISFDGVNIWVTSAFDNTVSKLNTSTGAVVGTYAVGSWPQGIAFDGINMWVTNYHSGSVSKL
jgi:YVTN family beta-propeller protein